MAFCHDLFAGVNEAVLVVEHHCVRLEDTGSVLVACLHLLVVEGVLVFLNFHPGGLETLNLSSNVAHKVFVNFVDGRLIDFDLAYSYAVYDLNSLEGLHIRISP